MLFLLFFLPVSVFPVEISLEENKAESGTVGYVDIVKVFDRFTIDYKKAFDMVVAEKQKIIDDRKNELNSLKAKKEKLNFEYQMAKMYEEFNKSLLAEKQISTDTVMSSQTASVNIEISTSNNISQINNSSVYTSTDSVQINLSSSTQTETSDSTRSYESPYIVMPGVGKVPISNYKFSVSSSPADISRSIEDIDTKISDIEKNISEMKKKFDEELNKKAAKDNEYVLKKIYTAIEEVAKKEGVSVVVDKKNILFGRKTVDLTDKVLKKLEE